MPKSIKRTIECFDITGLTEDEYRAVLDAIEQQHHRNFRSEVRHELHDALHQVWSNLRHPHCF